MSSSSGLCDGGRDGPANGGGRMGRCTDAGLVEDGFDGPYSSSELSF